MQTMTVNLLRPALGLCPYCDKKADLCGASLSGMRPGPAVRKDYCEDEGYDSCALFLAKTIMK